MFYRIISTMAVMAAALFLFPSGQPARAAEPTVVINELMWMGSSASSSDEWIELRNFTDAPIDIGGWQLTKKSGGAEVTMLTIPAGKSIPGSGFFLISNFAETSASSLLAVTPDLVDSDVSLTNSDIQIKLYDAAHVLIDTADDGSGTPLSGAYDSALNTHASMERNSVPGDGTLKASWHAATIATGWKAGATELGTPGAANSPATPVAVAGPDLSGIAGDPISFDGSGSIDPEGRTLSFAWGFGDGSTSDQMKPTHVYAAAGSFTATLTVSNGTNRATDSVKVEVKEKPATVPATNASLTNTAPPASSTNTNTNVVTSPSASAAHPAPVNTNTKNANTSTKKAATTKTATKTTTKKVTLPKTTVIKKTSTTKTATKKNTGPVQSVAIADLQSMQSGDRVRIAGQVTAPLGALGSNTIYVQDGAAGVAVQFSGHPPAIALGDGIDLTGTVRVSAGRRRVAVGANDPATVSAATVAMEPANVKTGEISNDMIDQLISMSGTIASVSGAQIEIDDGSGAATISIKSSTGIVRPKAKMGDAANVTGIVVATTSGLRILPRIADDLKIERVLGASISSPTNTTTPAASPQQALWYWGLVGLGGVGAGAKPAWKWWKERQNPSSRA